MKAALRALIFDVDGTLADTEECHRRAFNAAFAGAGLDWWWSRAAYRDLLRVSGGVPRMRSYAEREDAAMAVRADFPDLLLALHQDKTRRYDTLLREQPLPLRPGIARLFDEAAAEGLQLALAITTTAANLDALLRPHFGAAWRERFAALVCGGDVAELKPAPDAYLEVLQRLNLDPAEALAFEDSVNGIRSAEAAGLAVIATPTWYSQVDELPPALIVLAHLGDPQRPLPNGRPGAPFVNLACLRAWHAEHSLAAQAPQRISACC